MRLVVRDLRPIVTLLVVLFFVPVAKVFPKQANIFVDDPGKTLKRSPKTSHDYILRGDQYATQGDEQRAIADYSSAITLAPRNFYLRTVRARAYEKSGIWQLAIKDFDKAVELAPRNCWSYLARGDGYFSQNNISQAIDNYSKAISLAPEQPWFYVRRSNAYVAIENFEKSEADCDKSISLIPHNRFKQQYADLYLHRAKVFALMGQKEKASHDRDLARKLQSKNRWYTPEVPKGSYGQIMTQPD